MSIITLRIVRTFVNGIEADLARSALEAAGIHAVVRRDDCGGVRPSLWLAGISLLVPEADVEAADTVLSTPALYAATDAMRQETSSMPTVFDFEATAIDGHRVALDRYRGQVLLIVNVASRCGCTWQYRELEALYRAHRDRGFVVLGFPCDQFGRQEPGTEAEIRAFCTFTYDVTFPLFAKIDVNGARAHPLYRFLKAQRRGWLGSAAIKWNFTKFLIDREGRVAARYGSTHAPSSIERAIVELLDGAPDAAVGERHTR